MIYINAIKDRSTKPFGFEVFRPLYVTKTPHHMKSMQECEAKHFSDSLLKVRPGFILYTNWEHIAEHGGDVLDMPWEDRLGRPVYLDGR